MSNTGRIIHMQRQAAEIENKIDDLIEWLGKNTNSPLFMKVASDRNHFLAKLNAINYKINQLKAGMPILGEPDFPEVKIIQENQNQFKTIQ